MDKNEVHKETQKLALPLLVSTAICASWLDDTQAVQDRAVTLTWRPAWWEKTTSELQAHPVSYLHHPSYLSRAQLCEQQPLVSNGSSEPGDKVSKDSALAAQEKRSHSR